MLFYYVDKSRCFPLKRTGGVDASPIQIGDKVSFDSQYHKKSVIATVRGVDDQGVKGTLTLEV